MSRKRKNDSDCLELKEQLDDNEKALDITLQQEYARKQQQEAEENAQEEGEKEDESIEDMQSTIDL